MGNIENGRVGLVLEKDGKEEGDEVIEILKLKCNEEEKEIDVRGWKGKLRSLKKRNKVEKI